MYKQDIILCSCHVIFTEHNLFFYFCELVEGMDIFYLILKDSEDTHAAIETHTVMRESPSFRPRTLYVHVPSISIRHNCMSENRFRVGSRAGR